MASHSSHPTTAPAKKKIDEFKSSQLHGALKVHKSDMPDEMQVSVVEITKKAIDAVLAKNKIEKDIAVEIKKALDLKYPPAWHCIIGKHYAVSITHTTKYMMYFSLGAYSILCFKTE